MHYNEYEWYRVWLSASSTMASLGSAWLSNPTNLLSYSKVGNTLASGLDVMAHITASRKKPAFGITHTQRNGQSVPVTERIECEKPFGSLKHFIREGIDKDPADPADPADPKVLLLAPMSGHFATLARGTVERLLPNHDIWVTDWEDAKSVPLSEGSFDLDDYIDYLCDFIDHIGPGGHLIAVCQPAVPAYAAVALLSEDNHANLPVTLTVMGGPIDARIGPTRVNEMAQRPYSWFEHHLVDTVPSIYKGAGRAVYPGFMQLAGFISMNFSNHVMSHWEMFNHLIAGDGESAESNKAFYREYLSVCDITAEFYLQTIDTVFQKHLLPKGKMTHRGRTVNPKEIRNTALLAIEGKRDDISGVGQTKAALELATNLAEENKKYALFNTGHYGIFNGSVWRGKIAPVIEDFIRAHSKKNSAPGKKNPG